MALVAMSIIYVIIGWVSHALAAGIGIDVPLDDDMVVITLT